MRSAILSLWSTDPLGGERGIPDIDLGIVFALKDAELVPAAVMAAVHSSANRIKVVRLVTPNLDFPVVQESIEAVRQASLQLHFSLEIHDDASLLGPERLSQLQNHRVHDRGIGWVTQQLLKLSAVLMSSQRATLIVDADTILLRRRTWLAQDGRQILMAPEWYGSLWTEDVKIYLRLTKTRPFSFITHQQLMQRDLVENLFGANGEKLLTWALSARRRIAEYETYGTYLAEVYPERAVMARFGNCEAPWREEVGQVEELADIQKLGLRLGSGALSLSVHHYLQASEIRGLATSAYRCGLRKRSRRPNACRLSRDHVKCLQKTDRTVKLKRAALWYLNCSDERGSLEPRRMDKRSWLKRDL